MKYHVAQIDMKTGKLFDVKSERAEARAIRVAKSYVKFYPAIVGARAKLYVADVFFEGETYRVTPLPEPPPLPPLGAHLS